MTRAWDGRDKNIVDGQFRRVYLPDVRLKQNSFAMTMLPNIGIFGNDFYAGDKLELLTGGYRGG